MATRKNRPEIKRKKPRRPTPVERRPDDRERQERGGRDRMERGGFDRGAR